MMNRIIELWAFCGIMFLLLINPQVVYGQLHNADHQVTELYAYVEVKFGINDTLSKMRIIVIIDGIPFGGESLEVKMNNSRLNEFGEILLIEDDTAFLCGKNWDYVILIRTKASQTQKEKKDLLKDLVGFYNDKVPSGIIRDWMCSTCKSCLLNGVPLGPFEAKRVIHQLRISDIVFISVSSIPVNEEIYGTGSLNGQIEITTN